MSFFSDKHVMAAFLTGNTLERDFCTQVFNADFNPAMPVGLDDQFAFFLEDFYLSLGRSYQVASIFFRVLDLFFELDLHGVSFPIRQRG